MSRGKGLKLIGTSILLTSFIIQWTVFANSTEKKQLKDKAEDIYSQFYTNGLIYQNLFYTQSLATGVADGAVLTKAAQQNSLGLTVSIAASDLETNDKKETIMKVVQLAGVVNDLDSFNAYMSHVNQVEGRIVKQKQSDYSVIESSINRSSLLHAALYILGSLCLLIGMYYEKE